MSRRAARDMPVITWAAKRRGNLFIGVVYFDENPRTVTAPTSKQLARYHARKRAAEFRALAGK